jgi:hypothetical protein
VVARTFCFPGVTSGRTAVHGLRDADPLPTSKVHIDIA